MKQPVLLSLLLALLAGAVMVFLLWPREPEAPQGGGDVPKPKPVKPAVDPNRARPDESPQPVVTGTPTSIGGTVVGMDGSTIWRVRVRCMLGPVAELSTTMTDRQGRFRFDGLDEKTVYSIEASTRKHAPQRKDNVEPGTANLVLNLRVGGRLAGSVLSGDIGKPIEAFTVRLVGPESRTVAFEDSGGSFTIQDLKGGRYAVVISADGYMDADRKIIEIKAGGAVRENFLLPPLPEDADGGEG